MLQRKLLSLVPLFLLLIQAGGVSQEYEYVQAMPDKGDGLYSFLRRWQVPTENDYLELFKEINKGNFNDNGGLLLGVEYNLPYVRFTYNGRSIRSTIGIDNYNHAKMIQDYNLELYRKGLKSSDYRKSRDLWVLYYDLSPEVAAKAGEGTEDDDGLVSFDIFGSKYQHITVKDNKLNGCIYYLVGGHGGPDPGAIGYKDGHQLCEDEYAYDVILRLGRKLIEHGAIVYFIVRDSVDGIRDEAYLECDHDEFYYGNEDIHIDQIYRLRKRAEIVNNLYYRNKSRAKTQQTVVIHVDSRITNEHIDIFFYHKPGSRNGKKLAENMFGTIKNKYEFHQPGRGYHGFVSSRSLHMLREVVPTGVYIELGNIQNKSNQIRLIETGNREAIADWLCDGLIKSKNIK